MPANYTHLERQNHRGVRSSVAGEIGAKYAARWFQLLEHGRAYSRAFDSYVVFNAMTSYRFNDHLKMQVNLNNVTDKLYFTSVYYVGVAENHALPSAGRTLIGTVSYQF